MWKFVSGSLSLISLAISLPKSYRQMRYVFPTRWPGLWVILHSGRALFYNPILTTHLKFQ